MIEGLAHRCVLVAGDRDEAEALGTLLRAAGAEAHAVSSAESARRHLDGHRTDLLVTDVDLEELCAGFDLAMALRLGSTAPPLLIVLTSAVPATCRLLADLPVSWLPCDRFLSGGAGRVAMVEAVAELMDGPSPTRRAVLAFGA